MYIGLIYAYAVYIQTHRNIVFIIEKKQSF